MVLVLIFLILFILILGLIFSKIKIVIDKLVLSNENKNRYDIKINIYLYGILKIISLKINSKKIDLYGYTFKTKKIYKKILKNFNLKEMISNVNLNDIKKLNIKLKRFHLKFNFYFGNVILTSYLTAFFSTAISILLRFLIDEYNDKDYYYSITPKYIDKNYYKLKLDSIIELKTVHIINIMYKLYIKGDEYNARASNRRFNDNCNE